MLAQNVAKARRWRATEAAIGGQTEVWQVFARDRQTSLECIHVMDHAKINARAMWSQARERRETPAATYLLGEPLLPDYLEDALAAYGQSCRDFESGGDSEA